MIKVSITTKDGSILIADDSVVERQGTAVYKQICNKEDVLFKDSSNHIVFIPYKNVVMADVSEVVPPTPPEPVKTKIFEGTITTEHTESGFITTLNSPIVLTAGANYEVEFEEGIYNLTGINGDEVIYIGDYNFDEAPFVVTYDAGGPTTTVITFDAVTDAPMTIYRIEEEPEPGPDSDLKAVRFIDYDGTVVYSYSRSEFMAFSTLPDNPSHEGLIAQGWNWSLEDAQEYMEKYPKADMTIGQMYITESGDTEIDIELSSPERLSPYIGLCIDGSVTVDWGDESTDTITGNDLTAPINTKHDYVSVGNYIIKIHVDTGSVILGGFDEVAFINDNEFTNKNNNYIYYSLAKSIRIGSNAQLGDFAFYRFSYLESISMPNGIESIPDGSFEYCYSLKSLTIPSTATTIGEYSIYYAYNVASISLPNGIISIGEYAIYATAINSITVPESIESFGDGSVSYNNKLEKVVVPDSITELTDAFSDNESLKTFIFSDSLTALGDNAFSGVALKSVVIPDTVITFGKGLFKSSYYLNYIGNFPPSDATEIKEFTFYGCYSLPSVLIPNGVTLIDSYGFGNCEQLKEIEIPESVTQIKTYAFNSCTNLKEYHFKGETPPTLNNRNVFNGIPDDAIIYVPYSEDHSVLNAYKTATNWSNYASHMQEEEA